MHKDVHTYLLNIIKQTLQDFLPKKSKQGALRINPAPRPSHLRTFGFLQGKRQDITRCGINLEPPKDRTHGDISCNVCHILAKPLNRSPIEIANDFRDKLQDKINKTKIKKDIDKIEAKGGFINIFLSNDSFYNFLITILKSRGRSLSSNIGRSKLVQVEFVSANPTGPLSVAHARQAAVGDSLSKVLETLGFSVKREYYLNDEGRQVDLLGQSIQARFKELTGSPSDFPTDGYQGEYINELAKDIFNSKKSKVKNEDLDFFRDYGIRRILVIIKDELQDFGVRFDIWRSQKSIRQSGKINKVINYLKKKNLAYEQEGALWFKSTQFGDTKDRVIIKSDKSFTYLAPDIAYHQDKFKRGFKWIINIWGPDHHGYVPRIEAAVSALGYPRESVSIIIVQLATLYRNKEIIPMSTRKGQYITLRQVLNEVGRDAARFFFLMRRTDSHLDFDLELAKKQSQENPVYYVQYAYARIVNILKNAPPFNYKKLLKADLSLLKQDEELNLIKCLCSAKEAMLSSYRLLDVYPIVVYVQELAAIFHRFYDRHRVLGEKEEVMHARLALVETTRIVLKNFLDILGVTAPEKM